jgi:hypothetical protein
MSPRPYWKGYLKLSLVSCPIAVHAACSSAERVSFRQINRETGNRLRQQLIDEETREVVEADDGRTLYQAGRGRGPMVGGTVGRIVVSRHPQFFVGAVLALSRQTGGAELAARSSRKCSNSIPIRLTTRNRRPEPQQHQISYRWSVGRGPCAIFPTSRHPWLKHRRRCRGPSRAAVVATHHDNHRVLVRDEVSIKYV